MGRTPHGGGVMGEGSRMAARGPRAVFVGALAMGSWQPMQAVRSPGRTSVVERITCRAWWFASRTAKKMLVRDGRRKQALPSRSTGTVPSTVLVSNPESGPTSTA